MDIGQLQYKYIHTLPYTCIDKHTLSNTQALSYWEQWTYNKLNKIYVCVDEYLTLGNGWIKLLVRWWGNGKTEYTFQLLLLNIKWAIPFKDFNINSGSSK